MAAHVNNCFYVFDQYRALSDAGTTGCARPERGGFDSLTGEGRRSLAITANRGKSV
jgi:hypothetical protein